MDICASALLIRGVGGLENEDGLGCEEETGGVEQGVGAEEDDGVDEDGGPDCGCKLYDALAVNFIGRIMRDGEKLTIHIPACAMIAVPKHPQTRQHVPYSCSSRILEPETESVG